MSVMYLTYREVVDERNRLHTEIEDLAYEVERLSLILDNLWASFEPVTDWFGHEPADQRPDDWSDELRLAIESLQEDRAEVLRFRSVVEAAERLEKLIDPRDGKWRTTTMPSEALRAMLYLSGAVRDRARQEEQDSG